ncbi:ribosome maturation factor [Gammaproteobacteria bacterium]|nr:ribosome maturation factor [Gammaproteobacteria bacterium]
MPNQSANKSAHDLDNLSVNEISALNNIDANKIILGKINGVHGLKGYVKIFSETRPRDAITQYKSLYVLLKKEWSLIKVIECKVQSKNIIGLFEGYADINIAEQLIGATLAISQAQLPKLQEDEFFWRDLIGMAVQNTQGISFGIVKAMMETGANDVLICHDEISERLVPFTKGAAIISVDMHNKLIIVDWDADF